MSSTVDSSAEEERTDWTGRTATVRVGAVAHGGHCASRVDGRVVFVRHALPGELAEIEVTEDPGGSFCRADAVRIVEPADGRVEPDCAVSGPGGCGGCDFQHASPETGRALKAAVVAEQLSRLGGVDLPVEVEALPGGPSRWRTRARLAVDEAGRPGFRAHRSHTVIPVADCPITDERALTGVLEATYSPGGEVEVAVDDAGTRHVAEAVPKRSGRRGTPEVRAGDGTLTQRAAGRDWRLSARGFWQVHAHAADVLTGVVAEYADARPGEKAWDLYGGVGLFGAVLAAQVGERGSVLVVEASRQAVADGRDNLAELSQVRFVASTVERLLTARGDHGPRPARPDVVVLDPPRAGAGKQVVRPIAAAGPRRVVYVACDPAALGRDVALFARNGYRLTALRAFDAFPMTHHVECVALFEPSTEDSLAGEVKE